MARFDHAILVIASLLGALAVISGAFGAHALKAELDANMMTVYHAAASYHLSHALALGLTGLLLAQQTGTERAKIWFRYAAVLFLVGLILFCGSLYALALSGQRWLGMITPLGGMCFIIAWLALAFGASKR